MYSNAHALVFCSHMLNIGNNGIIQYKYWVTVEHFTQSSFASKHKNEQTSPEKTSIEHYFLTG